MKRRADPLLALVESYFNQHLGRVRNASAHTVRAYGHALRLFFSFVARRTRRSISALCLDDITIENVLAFLDDLESSRRNTAATRNCRLAAVHGLEEHLLRHDISRAKQYQRILSVRAKKARGRAVIYLEPEQVRAILAPPGPAHMVRAARPRLATLPLQYWRPDQRSACAYAKRHSRRRATTSTRTRSR